jgi:hypothetical protein
MSICTSSFCPRTLNEIAAMLNERVPNSDKYGGTGDKGDWHHDYLDYYETLLGRFPAGFALLEIGVYGGYSVASFAKRYSSSHIHGVDIQLGAWYDNVDRFGLTPSERSRLHVQQADATDASIVHRVPTDLDVMLDDGSHVPEQIIWSFELLFPSNLRGGGMYIVEDVHCDQYPFPFMEYAKSLLPFVYKYKDFKTYKMLSRRESVQRRLELDWRYQIKDITFS